MLTARTDGRVTRIAVREGEQVQAGDLLLSIADNQAADRLREADAALPGAKNRLAAAEARAQLAQKTYERYRRLFDKEAVTPQEMDRVTAEVEEARQQVAAAEAAVAGAAVGAKRRPHRPRLFAGHRPLCRPGGAHAGGGRVHGAAGHAAAGPRSQRRHAGARQSSRNAGGADAPSAIRYRWRSPPSGKLFGTVGEVQAAADPRSRTFPIKVDLPEAQDAGLFARVVFAGSDGPMLLLPASAVSTAAS